MANELDTALKNVAAQIAKYVQDAAELNVETKSVEVGANTDFSQARPVARTVIKLDGDCEAVVPVAAGAAGQGVDTALFDVHQRNVTVAIEYRARLLNALVGALRRG
jgi:hypothetical protein